MFFDRRWELPQYLARSNVLDASLAIIAVHGDCPAVGGEVGGVNGALDHRECPAVGGGGEGVNGAVTGS